MVSRRAQPKPPASFPASFGVLRSVQEDIDKFDEVTTGSFDKAQAEDQQGPPDHFDVLTGMIHARFLASLGRRRARVPCIECKLAKLMPKFFCVVSRYSCSTSQLQTIPYLRLFISRFSRRARFQTDRMFCMKFRQSRDVMHLRDAEVGLNGVLTSNTLCSSLRSFLDCSSIQEGQYVVGKTVNQNLFCRIYLFFQNLFFTVSQRIRRMKEILEGSG